MLQLQSVQTRQKVPIGSKLLNVSSKKESPKDKWATSTFTGKETHFIRKVSRYDNIKIV